MCDLLIKNAEEKDASLLRHLAANCPPLDVHTHYTYWVLCRFNNESCFIMYDKNTPVGYITSLDTDEGVFVWQIGILENYRSKGNSALLIDKVYEYACLKNKDMLVTIAQDNKTSYCAFKSFSSKNSLSFEPVGALSIDDFDDPKFNESEIIYRISR